MANTTLHQTSHTVRAASVPVPSYAPNRAFERLRRAVHTRLFGEDETRPERIGRYLITGPLGYGGMGVVFSGYDPDLDRDVAIKVLHFDSFRESERERMRLLREAQAMARLSHPNVVHVYETGVHAGRVFIAMELVDGPTLRAWTRSHNGDWKAILDRFSEAGRGLAAAHGAGLVHRDFKPENVLVGDDGRCRVADFGLVRVHDEATDATSEHVVSRDGPGSPLGVPLTREGSILGTPQYMAPEQHEGRLADARSDQFSFCVALFEAVYGQHPFEGDTVPSLRRAVLAGELRTPPSGVASPALLAVLRRGMATCPAERFDSIETLLAELSRARNPSRRFSFGMWLVGMVVLGGVALWAVRSAAPHSAGACPGLGRAQELRVEVAETRSRLEDLLPTPAGPNVATRVDEHLQRYLGEWEAAYDATCNASPRDTSVFAEQLCLQWRADEVVGLLEVLNEADEVVARSGPLMLAALRRVDTCDGTSSLPHLILERDDAVAGDLISQLARARALWHSGELERAVESARTVAVRAVESGIPALEADALVLANLIQHVSGPHNADLKRYYDELDRAIAVGEASNNHTAVARARVLLALTPEDDSAATSRQRQAELEPLLEGASDPTAWWLFLRNRATSNDVPRRERVAAARQVVQIFEAHFGTGHTFERSTRQVAAVAGLKPALTSDEATRGVKELRHIFGEDSPRAAEAAARAGRVALRSGDLERAKQQYATAARLWKSLEGHTSTQYGSALRKHAYALALSGRHDASIEKYDDALVALADNPKKDHNGEEHVLSSTRNELAGLLRKLGRHEEAFSQAERALSERQENGYSHPNPAFDLYASLLLDLDRPSEALQFYETAERSWSKQGVVDRHWAPEFDIGQAEVLLKLGRGAEALQHLQAAEDALSDSRRRDLADIRARLSLAKAQALHDVGRDARQVCTAAEQAKTAWRGETTELDRDRLLVAETLLENCPF